MRIFLIIAITAYLLSCNEQQAVTEASAFNLDSVNNHIAEMNKTYGQRFVTKDSIFYVNRYCKDAEVYAPGLPAVKGRETIRSFFFQGGEGREMVIELPTGNFYGNEDLVIEESTYNFPDGKGGSVDKGKFIAIWKQEDGKWKLYREIWNTDVAPVPSK
jgi:ketosteroid isomerase-like protein